MAPCYPSGKPGCDRIKIEYEHSVVVYQRYLTRLGEMIIFSIRLENHQFSQPR